MLVNALCVYIYFTLRKCICKKANRDIFWSPEKVLWEQKKPPIWITDIRFRESGLLHIAAITVLNIL
jgi:hypothetical protein